MYTVRYTIVVARATSDGDKYNWIFVTVEEARPPGGSSFHGLHHAVRKYFKTVLVITARHWLRQICDFGETEVNKKFTSPEN